MESFIVWFFAFYIYHALGITLGYHRLLSHRSLKIPLWLEYLVISGGYLSFEGSPIFWVATHRLHHRYSDRPGDPHSPLDGLWHAFISWMWKPTVIITAEESRKIVPDLYRDPVYRALHCGHGNWEGPLCLALGILFRLVIYFAFGPVVLCANLLGTAIAFVGPLLVNTVAHLKQFGYQTYESRDGSRNVWFVALVALGEGWHNNHHAFPQSARHGLKTIEIDFTWIAIKTLQLLGLATHIRLPNAEAMKAAQVKIGGSSQFATSLAINESEGSKSYQKEVESVTSN
jgi:fatty-acid desaturase